MLRVVLIGCAIAAVTLVLIPFQWIAVALRLTAMRRIPVLYHRIVCALLDVHVSVAGTRLEERPLLIVSNHVSWLDISVITSVAPVVFVAKREVASWPLFGLLAKLQRSVFVDRNQRHKTPDVNAEIARRLADGDPVLLFGEGTSSDGNRVLPFRTALIDAARDALAAAGHVRRVWIQPLSIAYTGLHGSDVSTARWSPGTAILHSGRISWACSGAAPLTSC
jgi:1-acyl-sn-glycerol-3-phosphate acyltransferase